MLFDLENLIQPVPGLESLSEPFSDEEINEVLKHLPLDRAPGPDGFTGLFVKKCWHIIKEDFLKLKCQEAYSMYTPIELPLLGKGL